MPVDQAVADQLAQRYHVVQQANVAQVLAQLAQMWAALSFDDLDASWAAVGPQVVGAVTLGQVAAAQSAPAYVERLLVAASVTPDPVSIVPSAFGGLTSAGIPLEAVLGLAPIRAKQRISAGATVAEARAAGFGEVTLLASTEVHDAARGSMDVAIGTQRTLTRYVRVPDANACDRCIILAGKVYAENEGFARHPRCGCTHRPLAPGERGDPTTPRRVFDQLAPDEQVRRFGQAGAEAIRAGANVAQVVNAKKGMSAPGELFTTQGRQPKGGRLSPHGCRVEAGGNRDRYLALLKRNRYIR